MAAFYAVGHLMAFFFEKNAHKKAQIPGSVYALLVSSKAYADHHGLVLLCTDKAVT